MGKNGFQTLYYGKRPSCVRIYDKVAERIAHFELWKRRETRLAKKAYAEYAEANHLAGWKNISRGVPSQPVEKYERDFFQWPQFPTVQEWLSNELPQALPIDFAFGSNQQPDLIPGTSPAAQQPLRFPVLTRVENQLGGRVPDNLHTMGEMRKNVLDFNPFERMTLVKGRVIPPGLFDKDPDGKHYRFPVPTWGFYQWVYDNWDTYGAARMRQMLNRDRNGKLYIRKLTEAGFLPYQDDGLPGISESELFERYRDSVSWQLAA